MTTQERKDQNLGKLQIKKSRANLDAAVRSTYQEIMSIKLKNEQFQKTTYQEESQRQQQRQQEIMDEAKSSAQRNGALEMRWNELKELEECEELQKQIKDQTRQFDDIIEGKERLIKSFWTELKKKDEDYVKMLKEQSDDIREMIRKMRFQFSEIRETDMRELETIEQQFEEDRKNLLDLHKEEIKRLFDHHRDFESQYVAKHAINDDTNYQKIEELRIKGSKDYAALKIQMEQEIQNLQKCLEDMNALYILNTEKLDYNLKVLKEKHEENNHLSDELKRKDGNLNNRLRRLTKEYIEQDKEFKRRNKLLTQEYKRITRQFKELQRKFKHFEKADSQRYTEIQKMNEEEVRLYKEKIIKCDITIHIQQLGTQWVPVEQDAQTLAQQQQQQLAAQLQAEKDQLGEENKLVVSDQKLEQIIDMLLVEAEFLIDDRMTEELLHMPKEDAITRKLETIKKCLGIDNQIEEFNMFIEELIRKCRVKKETHEELQQPGEEGAADQGDGQAGNAGNNNANATNANNKDNKQGDDKKKKDKKEQEKPPEEEKIEEEEEVINLEEAEINQNEVIGFLISWLKDADNRKVRLEQMTTHKQQKQESERERKERIARIGKKYWENLTHVLPDRTFRIWKVLDRALSKYYELLLNRQKLIEETGELHNQNEELKNLLNQYLQINHELQIPPTRLINLEPN